MAYNIEEISRGFQEAMQEAHDVSSTFDTEEGVPMPIEKKNNPGHAALS